MAAQVAGDLPFQYTGRQRTKKTRQRRMEQGPDARSSSRSAPLQYGWRGGEEEKISVDARTIETNQATLLENEELSGSQTSATRILKTVSKNNPHFLRQLVRLTPTN